MRRIALGLTLVSLAMLVVVGAAAAGEEVSYSADGTTLKGYIARPAKADGKRPGVLVVHEWWGNNDYPRKRADMLAQLGYVALALDMYGDGKVASHPKDAGAFAGEVRKHMDVAEKRFRAALALLASQRDVDTGRIAAVGYCFGGGMVLEMARRGLPLAGVVSFHGSLPTQTPARPGGVKAKVLVLNGADDPFVKPEQIEAFKKEMDAAGVDYRFINYPGAVHAFTNPDATENGKKFNLPLAYDADADRKSWEEMQRLFGAILK
ncbi:MAG: dienelactone hydrolase [Candidatus Rokubacteria bacterium RIFCSPLOWO2_12_FULL_71_22]|nr:MAG: dienelactone hydrolase [Candidatus Rokubacteria bacterium RIFCSPLOWO2_12_FULL_71_22]